MEKINKLRDKYVDRYLVSMEERERISLLDNLVMSVEKVEEEAKHCNKANGMKVITDQQTSVVEFCGCLLEILSHELKIIHMKEKPSFWLVAEQISPKDTVKMIYRLDIRQSDHARCQVWVRHALIEGTMGSYLTLLKEDTKILKHNYRTSSFVRDLQKMEAAKSIIHNITTTVHFKIKVDYISYSDKGRLSSCSADGSFGGQYNRGRESPDNVATIEDSFSCYSRSYTDKRFDINKHSDTVSLPGDILKCKDSIVSNRPSIQNKGSSTKDESLQCISATYDALPACFGSEKTVDLSKCVDMPACTESEKRADIVQEHSTLNPNFLNVTSHKEGSADLSSNNSSTSSPSSGNENYDTIMDDVNVIVNKIRIISDEGRIKSTGDALNVYVKESLSASSSFQDRKLFLCQENNSPTRIEGGIDFNEESYGDQPEQNNSFKERTLISNIKNIINKSSDNCFANSSNVSIGNTNKNENEKAINNVLPNKTTEDSRNFNEEISSETIIGSSEVPMPCNECNNELNIDNSSKVPHRLSDISANDKLIDCTTPTSSHPTLNICGSLTHSETSAFKVVKRLSNASSDANLIPSTITNEDNNICYDMCPEFIAFDANNSQNKESETINVINECEVSGQPAENISSSGSIKTEEAYRNHDEGHSEIETSKKTIDELSSSSSSSKTEEEYRNQVNTYQSVPVEGSSQLANVLSNVIDRSSIYDDYFVPGIHNVNDIQTNELSDKKKLQIESPTASVSIPSNSTGTPYEIVQNDDQSKDFPSTDYVFSSPSTFSTLSSKLLEKTLFKRSSTLSSSYNSDKAVDEEHTVNTDSGSDSSAGHSFSFSLLADLGVTDDVIGIKEDHFSTPDSFMGFSSLEELENAISSCKHLINANPKKSPHRDELVTQLVKLRLKLHELREKDVLSKPGKMVLGHQFFKQGGMSSSLECDACAATIFPMLQNVFVCKDCGFHCHKRCMKFLEKPCVHNCKINSASCELNICPEVPLSAQQYRCADCFQKIQINDGQFDVRVCDYTGQKYCTKCHWNDTFVIPARVVHNWDFSCYKVSRQSKHLLIVLSKKPDIKLQNVNSSLFSFVDELRDVRTLRQQIMMMKTYLITCRIATEQRLLLSLQHRQHFVDTSDVYSLQDLIDTHNSVLLNELSRIHATFGKHIKFDCMLCQGKGFICEYCNGEEIIFPFDNHVVGCCCKGIFHRLCYSQNTCPKCERIEKKKVNEE